MVKFEKGETMFTTILIPASEAQVVKKVGV